MSENGPDVLVVSPEVVAELRLGRGAIARSFWRRAPGVFVFMACFIRELVLANITMAKVVLFQKNTDLAPDFFAYDTTGLTSFEIVLLTHCITLTPGTTSVELNDEGTRLVVHALDARDPAAVCLGIKQTLERPLLGWTR